MNYEYVQVNAFVPNSTSGWSSFADVASYERTSSGTGFLLRDSDGRVLQLAFLSPTALRVRFNAGAEGYDDDSPSYAVVNRSLGPVTPRVAADTSALLTIDTGAMQVKVQKQPFSLAIYRDGQLIHADATVRGANKGLLYVDGQPSVASIKVAPENAVYVGLGEKAGSQLKKNGFSMTFFNYDNFKYGGTSVIPAPPAEGCGGPLNPSEPLYNSIPLLIEVNPSPTGAYAGRPYSYGIFLDNPAQTYVNIGADVETVYPSFSMQGMYYFGALYGDLDYYFLLGDGVPSVVDQYTQLTGRPTMVPRYVFGYHQGAYGYYSREVLEQVAQSFRDASFPIDGLHIDVDFQNNYRTFTSSDKKFPNVSEMFSQLAANGFKCSTNITALVTCNPYDEDGKTYDEGGVRYDTRDEGLANDYFIFNTRVNQGSSPQQFIAQENYGVNYGLNPFTSPPLQKDPEGYTPLISCGFYPNLGDPAVQAWWGQQYEGLLSAGLEMIWQDMTCPAIEYDRTPQAGEYVPYEQLLDFNTSDHDDCDEIKTLPLDLMMVGPDGKSYQPHALLHNGYALSLCKATFNGINALRPGRRNFIIARGGYAGVQRYAALWTGDSASSWDFLKVNIPEVLNLGMSGVPISGCDIGGFATGSGSTQEGYVTDPALFVRWMNVGAFLPWYRNHYDHYEKWYQEPYNYGEPYLSYCRKYVELRYRLNQVFYDAMYRATQTGMPICRAMFLNFPDDVEVYDHLDDQFFLGDFLLIAPIVDEGDTRTIYLPRGADWYPFPEEGALGAKVAGGTNIGVTSGTTPYHAPLGVVPIYVQAGAILPMRQLEQWVGQLPQNILTITVFPGPSSSYALYQDDGISTGPSYRLSSITQETTATSRSVRVTRKVDRYTPPEPYYYVALLGVTAAPSRVTAGKATIPCVADASSLSASTSNAYTYDAATDTVTVKIFDTSADITVNAALA
ncbi:TIM-barrel domain-containing protein [Sorangium sp. So ce542]|uniref:TIM-barrel domain-containing protein n=1 Tax=Sorangium sp. So ce542 TaxID=3133316 RepID=UPI003F629198